MVTVPKEEFENLRRFTSQLQSFMALPKPSTSSFAPA